MPTLGITFMRQGGHCYGKVVREFVLCFLLSSFSPFFGMFLQLLNLMYVGDGSRLSFADWWFVLIC